MRLRASQILYAYWNDVRADRLAPQRFEIEPSSMAAILSETAILEIAPEQGCRFRLAGTRILELFGRELRGLDLVEMWSAEDQVMVKGALRTLVDQGGCIVLTFTGTSDDGRQAALEGLLLPLIHHDGEIRRVLATFGAVETAAWLTTRPLASIKLDHVDIVWPEGRPHALLAKAQHQAPFDALLQQGRIVTQARRRFRVFEGGRADEKG